MIAALQQILKEVEAAYVSNFGDLKKGVPEEVRSKPFPTKGLFVALGMFMFWACFIGY